jgi:hypothetical protein
VRKPQNQEERRAQENEGAKRNEAMKPIVLCPSNTDTTKATKKRRRIHEIHLPIAVCIFISFRTLFFFYLTRMECISFSLCDAQMSDDMEAVE